MEARPVPGSGDARPQPSRGHARRRPRRRPLRLALLGVVLVAAVAVGLVARDVTLVKRAELATVDARFSLRGDRRPPKNVAIVGIDGATLGAIGRGWPFPRRFHAMLLDRLHASGAAGVAYDVTFSDPSDPADDRALLAAVRRAGPITLAAARATAAGEPVIVSGAKHVRGLGARLAVAGGYAQDPGGELRRVKYAVEGVKTLPVASAEMILGHPLSRAGFGRDGGWIDFRGPPGTFPTYSFSEVLAGHVPASAFRGKLVVVGATTPTLQDVHPTPPSGKLMAGAEIEANAIATALDGMPLRSAAGWVDVLLVIALGAAVPLVTLRWGIVWGAAAALALLIALAVAVQLAFDSGSIVDLVAPALALALATAGSMIVDYFTEARKRHQVERVFGRFVPAQVVRETMAMAGDDLRLGGTQMDATVLFCDLRGFTPFAENRPAAAVIDVLNRYLTEMSEAIREAGGTVVSYIGDGIMAVFGAPIAQLDHADRALRAAEEMLTARLAAFNEWLRSNDLGEPFKAGIGLSSGPVMSGNVGAPWRLEYTAVGDTTNVAARLQDKAGELGASLLIAESTRSRLSLERELVHVGELHVSGRGAPIQVWSEHSLGSPGEASVNAPTAAG